MKESWEEQKKAYVELVSETVEQVVDICIIEKIMNHLFEMSYTFGKIDSNNFFRQEYARMELRIAELEKECAEKETAVKELTETCNKFEMGGHFGSENDS